MNINTAATTRLATATALAHGTTRSYTLTDSQIDSLITLRNEAEAALRRTDTVSQQGASAAAALAVTRRLEFLTRYPHPTAV